MLTPQWDLPPDACIEKISSKVMLHMQKNIVVYGYNAASHSLGVAMHSGSGVLCRGLLTIELPQRRKKYPEACHVQSLQCCRTCTRGSGNDECLLLEVGFLVCNLYSTKTRL